jgi:hypothetical protein
MRQEHRPEGDVPNGSDLGAQPHRAQRRKGTRDTGESGLHQQQGTPIGQQ